MPLGLEFFQSTRKAKKANDLTETTSIAYPSGFLPLDYVNGQIVKVFDDDDNVKMEYDSVGFVDGTFITVIADSGLGKTTLTQQIASQIASVYDNSFIIHEDIERSANINRVYNITGYSAKWIRNHYVIYQDNHAETVLDRFIDHAKTKLNNRKVFSYDSGLYDLYGKKIERLIPTVVIIDSLAVMRSEDGSILNDLSGGKNKDDMDTTVGNNMQAARAAKFNSEMFKQMLPWAKRANIIIFVINHINRKIEMGFVKGARDLVGLGENEAISGGRASIYIANNVLRLKNKGQLKPDKDYGINGYIIDATFYKSRSAATNVSCELIFDKSLGFSKSLTLLHFGINNNLVKKKGNSYYIPGNDDILFTKKNFCRTAVENPQILETLYDLCLPSLRAYASSADEITSGASDDKDESFTESFNSIMDML